MVRAALRVVALRGRWREVGAAPGPTDHCLQRGGSPWSGVRQGSPRLSSHSLRAYVGVPVSEACNTQTVSQDLSDKEERGSPEQTITTSALFKPPSRLPQTNAHHLWFCRTFTQPRTPTKHRVQLSALRKILGTNKMLTGRAISSRFLDPPETLPRR